MDTTPTEAPGTPEDRLQAFRAQAVEKHGDPGDQGFTCDTCPEVSRCQWAFDWYNTDGDCLAVK